MNDARAVMVSMLLLLPLACAPEFSVQGRPYELRLPQGLTPDEAVPLVVMVHGYGLTGPGQDVFFPISNALRERKFAYALPSGTVDRFGKRFWNATDFCCDFGRVQVDDVSFLKAVIDDVKARQKIDARKVFLVSHSNGGFMSLRMACDASDVVSGVVSVAGAAWQDFSKCQSGGAPVSVLQIHGVKDSTVLYQGTDRYPSALGTVERFATRNGCGPVKRLTPIDLTSASDAETTVDAFDSCPTGGAVELWSIAEGSHLPSFNKQWPTRVFDWLVEHSR
jgi:polyhydroxybutyrate depolymerase